MARPDRHAAQMLAEAMEQEAALQFLAHAAGQHGDDEKDGRVERRAQEVLERAGLDVVQPGQRRADEQDQQRETEERDGHQRQAEPNLAARAAGVRRTRRASARR